MEKKINIKRTWVLFGLILAVCLIFGLVLIEIQIVHGQSYSELATKGATRSQIIQAARGRSPTGTAGRWYKIRWGTTSRWTRPI